jgi:hypothetical protein
MLKRLEPTKSVIFRQQPRFQRDLEEYFVKEVALKLWLEQILGIALPRNYLPCLCNGVYLCQVMLVLRERSIPVVNIPPNHAEATEKLVEEDLQWGDNIHLADYSPTINSHDDGGASSRLSSSSSSSSNILSSMFSYGNSNLERLSDGGLININNILTSSTSVLELQGHSNSNANCSSSSSSCSNSDNNASCTLSADTSAAISLSASTPMFHQSSRDSISLVNSSSGGLMYTYSDDHSPLALGDASASVTSSSSATADVGTRPGVFPFFLIKNNICFFIAACEEEFHFRKYVVHVSLSLSQRVYSTRLFVSVIASLTCACAVAVLSVDPSCLQCLNCITSKTMYILSRF